MLESRPQVKALKTQIDKQEKAVAWPGRIICRILTSALITVFGKILKLINSP